jgi:hypothetical protein
MRLAEFQADPEVAATPNVHKGFTSQSITQTPTDIGWLRKELREARTLWRVPADRQ